MVEHPNLAHHQRQMKRSAAPRLSESTFDRTHEIGLLSPKQSRCVGKNLNFQLSRKIEEFLQGLIEAEKLVLAKLITRLKPQFIADQRERA